MKEKRLDSLLNVKYPYVTGELEGGERRATDPNWSLKVYKIDGLIVNKGGSIRSEEWSGERTRQRRVDSGPRDTELPP